MPITSEELRAKAEKYAQRLTVGERDDVVRVLQIELEKQVGRGSRLVQQPQLALIIKDLVDNRLLGLAESHRPGSYICGIVIDIA